MDWFEGLFELIDGAWDVYKARRDGSPFKEILVIAIFTIMRYFIAIMK